MNRPPTPCEDAIAWAITKFGKPEVLSHLAPLSRRSVERALEAASFAGPASPAARIVASVEPGREPLARLRAALPAHWRGAMDRAVERHAPLPVDYVIAQLVTGAGNGHHLRASPELTRLSADEAGLNALLCDVGLRGTGVALVAVQGRNLARALVGLGGDEQLLVRTWRETPVDMQIAEVIRDAYIAIAAQTGHPRERATLLGLYLLAFTLEEQQATTVARVLTPEQRATFNGFHRNAERSSRRTHVDALRSFVFCGGKDGG